MPHIKVAPFQIDRLDQWGDRSAVFDFWAERTGGRKAKPERADRELLIGLHFEGERFALEVHPRDDHWLIKAEKSSRPLDAHRIKRALHTVAEEAGMTVLHHNIASASTPPPVAEASIKRIDDFESIDFGDRSVALEVGFGSGRHLLHQARTHPERLHIGIEIHTPSIRQVLRQIALQGLDNVWIVHYDARLLLEMLPSNVLETIWVHFPVPWDKKPHRRVISDPFVLEAIRTLVPEGYLELRTDSERYFRYALECFSRPESVRFDVTKNRQAAVRSKYEDRWLRLGKDLYTLRLFSDQHSASVVLEEEPIFERPPKSIEALLALPHAPIVRAEHFVHFEQRYRMISEPGALVRCSFGSVMRPEHKLIEVRRGALEYYPQPPVRSRANLAAHHIIGEYLYA